MTGKSKMIPRDSAANTPEKKFKSFHAGAAALAALPLEARGDDSLIVFDELAPLGIGYSRVHLRRLEDEKKFPRRVRLSARRVAWRAGDIRAFLQRLASGGAADA